MYFERKGVTPQYTDRSNDPGESLLPEDTSAIAPRVMADETKAKLLAPLRGKIRLRQGYNTTGRRDSLLCAARNMLSAKRTPQLSDVI